MFKAIYNAVSGNEITQKYEVEPQHCATGGHRFLWKIFNATHRKSRVPVSLFLLDKEDPIIKSMNKTQKEALFESFRKDITALKQFSVAKPAPNPNILRFFQTFEETKKEMAFISERVVFSLANALGHSDNLPDSAAFGQLNSSTQELMNDKHISALEATRGVSQILEALQFGVVGGGSTNGRRRLHLDVGPQNIYLTSDGQWRLSGWGFSLEVDGNDPSTLCPYFLQGDKNSEDTPVAPRLTYSAPELTASSQGGGMPGGLTPQADIFSVGLLMAEVFKIPSVKPSTMPSGGAANYSSAATSRCRSKPLLASVEDFSSTVNKPIAAVHHEAVNAMLTQGCMNQLSQDLSHGICSNPGLAQTVCTMLNPNPSHRPAVATLLANPVFHDPTVSALRKLDQLPSLSKRDPALVSYYLAGQLPDCLPRLQPPRIRRTCVLTQVLAAACEVPGLWPFVLPVIFIIVEDDSNDIHKDRFNNPAPAGLGIAGLLCGPNAPMNASVLNSSRQAKQYAAQLAARKQGAPALPPAPTPPPEWLPRALLEVCKHASTIIKLASREWVGTNLAPAIMVSLGFGVPSLAEASLKTLSEHANLLLPLLTSTQLEQEAVPGVCKLAVHSSHLSVKVNALKCVAAILPLLDETTVVKMILPTMRVVREKDPSPAVMMCVLGCYDIIGGRLGPSSLARHLLPGLAPLLDEKSLNTKQFEMVVSRVNTILKTVIDARRSELGTQPPDSSSDVSGGFGLSSSSSNSSGTLGMSSIGSGAFDSSNALSSTSPVSSATTKTGGGFGGFGDASGKSSSSSSGGGGGGGGSGGGGGATTSASLPISSSISMPKPSLEASSSLGSVTSSLGGLGGSNTSLSSLNSLGSSGSGAMTGGATSNFSSMPSLPPSTSVSSSDNSDDPFASISSPISGVPVNTSPYLTKVEPAAKQSASMSLGKPSSSMGDFSMSGDMGGSSSSMGGSSSSMGGGMGDFSMSGGMGGSSSSMGGGMGMNSGAGMGPNSFTGGSSARSINGGGLSIEEQMRQTQLEIERLQSQMGGGGGGAGGTGIQNQSANSFGINTNVAQKGDISTAFDFM